MKAQPMILRGTVAEVAAELRRRANKADTACLAGLFALLLVAALTH
jgi:hypothetical protein